MSVDSLEDASPMLELLPEYVNEQDDIALLDKDSPDEKGDFFVFLQKFPLEPIDVFFHTEVVVCNKDKFSTQQIELLEQEIAEMKDFAKVDKSVWSTWSMPCVELGYGGSFCEESCCSVPHGVNQLDYPLNAHRAVIMNADTEEKELYIYGSSDISGNQAFHDVCHNKCWSDWKGTDYNLITNNCNTFTSTVLSCVYGLSEKKPNLGISDMVDVTCANKCDALSKKFQPGGGETALM
eukprot:CAMPEP_0197833424 /NCGR_PEP_ID=MMETSP1437-20131217/19008_1 /TAXON_ID=49252 ORGANISM="Eucampia antarctica, Strain CCMP1452" /NCGR_SAMPLE_ID=MMETSP1437 /ASSEMBLY_ACC=CAM_ASM_001096 /LENGTH=236 /DNA_ID=CAMNT_0043437487 /DNA_START=100 /DNA_END=810 /DNA_ORIENTATION=+